VLPRDCETVSFESTANKRAATDGRKSLAESPVGSSGEDLTEPLVHEYTEVLLKGALSLGFPVDEAKDLVQSVWLTYFSKPSNFEGRSHIRTFLFGILYNKAREGRRKDRRLVTDEHIEQLVDSHFNEKGRWSAPPIDPEQFLQASQTMELIEDCLNCLPLKHRMAFCLREIEEEATSTICKILEVTTTNLGVMLFRAKARLRECLEQKAKDGRGTY